MKTLVLLLTFVASMSFAQVPVKPVAPAVPVVPVPPAKAPENFTSKITGCTWKWDHPTVKGRMMVFYADGNFKTTIFNGVWKITGERQVTLNREGKLISITFAKDFKSFIGKHHDGMDIEGKRLGDVPSSLK